MSFAVIWENVDAELIKSKTTKFFKISDTEWKMEEKKIPQESKSLINRLM